jgi:hypothetical protein
MNRLVVLTDLGTFKAYRLEDNPVATKPHLEPVDEYESIYGDDRISRRLSDQAGNFGRGNPVVGGSNDGETGERHNIWLENERRSVKQIAQRMTELLKRDEFESCYFAASNEINNAIIDALPAETRSKIEKNVHSNLVNAKRDEVLQHFA